MKARWRYLYRAIDKDGATLDSYLSERRNTMPARRFRAEAVAGPDPCVIDTDKNPAHDEAIASPKSAGVMPAEVKHRQAKYLNNRQGEHGQLKRLIRPTQGFKSLRTARATIAGFEVMQMFKKGRFRFWIDTLGGGIEVRFAHRLFSVYA